MIAAGSGLAVGPSLEDSALEACLQALARSGHDHADLALVFVTADAYASAATILHVIRRVSGARAVVGCSAAGVLTDQQEVEGESAVGVLTVHGERLASTPFMLEDQERIGTEAGSEALGSFAGLAMDPAKSPLERGDFLVRNLVGVDQSSGAIAVSEPVKVGQTIQFQIRDAQSAREDLHALLQGMAKRLGSRRPAFGCYFNCAGRGQGLFGVLDYDVTLIREHVGKFPLVEFFGNGEFAPIGRRNFSHTYTGALLVFPQDPA